MRSHRTSERSDLGHLGCFSWEGTPKRRQIVTSETSQSRDVCVLGRRIELPWSFIWHLPGGPVCQPSVARFARAFVSPSKMASLERVVKMIRSEQTKEKDIRANRARGFALSNGLLPAGTAPQPPVARFARALVTCDLLLRRFSSNAQSED
jgi:hypothetical protein